MKKLLFLPLLAWGIVMASSFSLDEIVSVNCTVAPQAPSFLKASDDVKPAYYSWLPEKEPENVVIFYHGGGAWSGAGYFYLAQETCKQFGIGMYLVDIRGHGNSEGIRGDAPATEQVWQDIASTISFVKNQHPNAKLFLGGHSSGAGLVLNYASWQKQSDDISGYVLLAPYLGARSGTNNPQAESFVNNVNLFAIIVSAITSGWLCAHRQAFTFNYPESLYESDNKMVRAYTCAMAHAVSPNNPKTIFENLTKPCALFIGANDEQFLPDEVSKYVDFMTHFKDESFAEIVTGVKHLSILCTGHEMIGQAIEQFNF